MMSSTELDTWRIDAPVPALFPFTAIVGQDEMKRALLLAAIDPSIGGVLVFGDRGTGKSTAVRALAALLPDMRVVAGCRYNCDPAAADALCWECRARLAGHRLDRHSKAVASQAIHWGFGAAAGAAYGALAEYYPAATSRGGATFGLTLLTLTHETALPAMGLEAKLEDQTPREHASEAATHVIYGVVAERVRRLVRRVLG